jgi:hypothetical protein
MIITAQVSAVALLFVSVAAAQPTTKPLDAGKIKHAEQVQTEATEVDAETAKLTPAGQKRVTEAIAKQFKVDPSLVSDLRTKKMGFGEITAALALSQELMKQNTALSQQQALDTVLAKRASGDGWGQIAHSLGVKLGHVRSELKRTEKTVARVEKAEKAEKLEKAEKTEKAEKPEKIEKAAKMEKPEKPMKAERPGR